MHRPLSRRPTVRCRSLSALAVAALSVAALAVAATAGEPAPDPLDHAHSHNDYHRLRPLADALELGFCSIEADVWLIDGQLLVGHDRHELQATRTLSSLYLAPLAARAAERGGWIYDAGRTVTLLIDLKTGGETFAAVERELTAHAELLAPRAIPAPGAAESRTLPPLLVVISGERPLDEFKSRTPRHARVDGRLADYAGYSARQMPLVSDAWPAHFSWRGVGPMPDDERAKLRRLTAEVHAAGRRLRFWATPDREAVWNELLAAEIDLIGADDLPRLAQFLRARR